MEQLDYFAELSKAAELARENDAEHLPKIVAIENLLKYHRQGLILSIETIDQIKVILNG